jgi:L-glyceraldehyde 3-phosphate reductase
MTYQPASTRYDNPDFYRRCGASGLKLPVIALGLWHNFGGVDSYDNSRAMLRRAFDLGVTHFDLANNYGPPEGSAEATLGRALKDDLAPYRNELVISTKAGYYMWPGPYGDGGSRKYLLASLDQSLTRMGLDHVDIFYSHRFDPETPLEETMGALATAVQSGRARYIGISSYPPEQTRRAAALLQQMGTPCLIHQPRYNMFDRTVEQGLLRTLEELKIGAAVFSPLAKGLLTDRYFKGIPADSRAGHDPRFLRPADVTDTVLAKARALNQIAQARGQTLAQLALAWVLRHPVVTTAIIGASKVKQIEDCVAAAGTVAFSADEQVRIDRILA